MRRWIAVVWQASFVAIAGVLYFLFVLPRWHELSGEWSHSLGTAMRIVAGVLVGLAALPVVFTLLKTRKPEYGTPTLALNLRLSSVVLHVLAAVLIVGAAIAEIWLSLDEAGQWLFGIYGAAAAIALLGTLAFYLAYLAELPPPPPKPLKLREPRARRGRRNATDDEEDISVQAAALDEDDAPAEAKTVEAVVLTKKTDAAEADETVEVEQPAIPAEAAETVVLAKTPETSDTPEATETPDTVETAVPANSAETVQEPAGKLRNRRPSGKTTSRVRGRSRGGVTVED